MYPHHRKSTWRNENLCDADNLYRDVQYTQDTGDTKDTVDTVDTVYICPVIVISILKLVMPGVTVGYRHRVGLSWFSALPLL